MRPILFRCRRFLPGALAALAAMPVAAAFHLWSINEVYSNADGTVQYVELTALAGGQQFLAGHTITSRSGATTHAYVFPTDLPGDTTGKRLLVGTQGYSALGIAAPDYIVPSGFLFPAGGTINFADADIWTHGALPAPPLALNRDGSTAANSPRNFAGMTGSIGGGAVGGAMTYQGLWWASPANSESGWGVNLTHQGDILFATWFTYDTDGSGMWLVMSNGNRTIETVVMNNPYGPGYVEMEPKVYFGGPLYRTTGPPFGATPFNSSAVGVTTVGSARFEFMDSNNGTFTYTVNGVMQVKPITRQVFSSPVPECIAGGAAGSTPNYQDLWWASPANSESGWGVNITHQGNILFATWFTYGADGKGQWLVMSNGERIAPNTYSGAFYRTRGPEFSRSPWAGPVTVTQAGTGTFTFTSAANGTFSYTVDGISQSKAITRQVYSSPASVCRTP